MRLYNFRKKESEIDVTCVTDGSAIQKRIFITESLRGVTPKGNVTNPGQGDAFLALGWKWGVGECVDHDELVDFAVKNKLKLAIYTQETNPIINIVPLWEGDSLKVTVDKTIPEVKIRLQFLKASDLSFINFAPSAAQKGTLVNPNTLEVSIKAAPLELALTDLGIEKSEELFLKVLNTQNLEIFVTKSEPGV